MDAQAYLNKMNKVQSSLLLFLENKDNAEENFHNLVKLIDDEKIQGNEYEFKTLLHMISKISSNHCEKQSFSHKIEQLLKFFQNDIIKNFSNFSIFNIFKSNKEIILFLIQEKVIAINKTIVNFINNHEKYAKLKYLQYFFPEMKPFIQEKVLEKISEEIPDDFEEKRRTGYNENSVCQLIQKDNINDFISYVNKNDIPLNSIIKPSIFETNSFLMKKEPTLIEYSAFFGSIQIFKYLFLNKAEMSPSIWIYAIHGFNPEIIHLLEENKVQLYQDHFEDENEDEDENVSYEKCFKEAIKCHHNDIAYYILSNYLHNESFDPFPENLKYFNFHFIGWPLNS